MWWKFLPTRLCSRIIGKLAKIPFPKWILVPFLKWYCLTYSVNTQEIEKPLTKYKNFSSFFCRRLKTGSRPINHQPNQIISGVDGTVQELGEISNNQIFQLKNHSYPIDHILKWEPYNQKFSTGSYIIIYLSPGDYHRIHAPVSGKVVAWERCKGTLYPVNQASVQKTSRLYATNERVTTYVDTEMGNVALVKIGAFNVGSIRLCYDSEVRSNQWFEKERIQTLNPNLPLNIGEEYARFELGSTLLMLFEYPVEFHVRQNQPVQWNTPIGSPLDRKSS